MRILSYIGRVRYYLRIFKPAYKHLKNSIPVLLFLGFVFSIVAVWWLGPKWELNTTYPLAPLMPRILATAVILLIAAVTFAIYTQKDAILIDPDGGLLTQKETQKAQEGELAGRLWEHFIEWLYKTRSRHPLNGLVLVIDLPRLINQTPGT